ncbi:hypothetical protein GC173_00990 [bacterium]|nr:hypothetical protein [bacterium]
MFWLFAIPSLIIVCAIMGTLFWMAKDVPDASHRDRKFRLNPELIRAIAYVAVILVCLIAAMYELSLYDDMMEP